MKVISKKDKELLRQYYDERLKLSSMPDFDNLDNWQIAAIQDSLGFAGWKFNYSLNQLYEAVKKENESLRKCLDRIVKFKHKIKS